MLHGLMRGPLVCIDRDGTCNVQKTGEYIRKPDDLELFKEFAPAVALLQRTGYKPVIVTNQQGIGKGEIDEEDYWEICAKVQREIIGAGGMGINIVTCPHLAVTCRCRKPEPGLLYYAAGLEKCDPENMWMIGDTYTDIWAVKKLSEKNRAILVQTGEGKSPENFKAFRDSGIFPDYIVPDIMVAARLIAGKIQSVEQYVPDGWIKQGKLL